MTSPVPDQQPDQPLAPAPEQEPVVDHITAELRAFEEKLKAEVVAIRTDLATDLDSVEDVLRAHVAAEAEKVKAALAHLGVDVRKFF